MPIDRFGARREISTPLGRRTVFQLSALGSDLSRIPYSVRILLEGALRHHDGALVDDAQVLALAAYDTTAVPETEIASRPGRVLPRVARRRAWHRDRDRARAEPAETARTAPRPARSLTP